MELGTPMDNVTVAPAGQTPDGRTAALQSHNHNFMLRVQAAIGPKHLDGHGLKGRVLVAFSISESGQLLGVRVAQSSGLDRLDGMAMQVVGKASFPSPPAGLGVAHRTYIAAFSFG
jgi:TonB family protein